MTTPSRAGRNLPAAIGVGLGLGAIVIVLLLFWRQGFVGIIVLAVGLASVFELRGTLVRPATSSSPGFRFCVGAAATIVLTWPYGTARRPSGSP